MGAGISTLKFGGGDTAALLKASNAGDAERVRQASTSTAFRNELSVTVLRFDPHSGCGFGAVSAVGLDAGVLKLRIFLFEASSRHFAIVPCEALECAQPSDWRSTGFVVAPARPRLYDDSVPRLTWLVISGVQCQYDDGTRSTREANSGERGISGLRVPPSSLFVSKAGVMNIERS